MSKAEVWRLVGQNTKAATFWSAAKWRQEAQRRRDIRVKTGPVLAGARAQLAAAQAANIPAEGKPNVDSPAVIAAKKAVGQARSAHPDSMLWLSTKVVAGVVAAGWFGLPLVPGAFWAWSAVVLAVLVVGAVAWAAKRAPKPQGLVPTKEEKQLLKRLTPKHWAEHCEGRGLKDTITGAPELSESGIVAAVRLDGSMTVTKLQAAEEQVRNLLGCRSDLRVEINKGKRGGWAEIALRTRSAADKTEMKWSPEVVGIGVDTVTGRPVDIPLDHRLTIAGASGSGKSWSSRPHMAACHLIGDLVFVDGKGEEAGVWRRVCRTAIEPDEIRAVVAEVHAEMNRRKEDMRERDISVWDGTQLTLFVDEGRVILAWKDKELVQQLIDISALGRSRGVVLKWATQYPVTSGDAPGIHAQIAANTDSRLALRVKNLTHAAVALDDDADYGPHLIPTDKRGHCYLGGHGAHLIRTWTMTDAMVKSLPKKVWKARATVSVVKDQEPPTNGHVPEQVNGSDAKVLDLVKRRPMAQKDIAQATGLPKGTVSKVVKRLMDAGQLVRHDDGLVGLVRTEATA